MQYSEDFHFDFIFLKVILYFNVNSGQTTSFDISFFIDYKVGEKKIVYFFFTKPCEHVFFTKF